MLATLKSYPLSANQEPSASNTLPYRVHMSEVDFVRLESAIADVKRHDVRLQLHLSGDRLCPLEDEAPHLEFLDFSSDFGSAREEKWFAQAASGALDPSEALHRLVLIRFSDGHGGFFANFNRLVFDPRSAAEIINEIVGVYHGSAAAEKLYESPTTDQEYWQKRFCDPFDEVALPYSLGAAVAGPTQNSRYQFGDTLSRELRQYCETNDTSEAYVVGSVLSAYLARITRLDDLTLGVDNLALRLSTDLTTSFSSYLSSFSEELETAAKHGCFCGSEQGNPSTVSMLCHPLHCQGADVEFLHPGAEPKPLQLALHLICKEQSTEIVMVRPQGLLDDADSDRIFTHLCCMLGDALKNPESRLLDLSIMEETERNHQLDELNPDKVPFPTDRTFIDCFNDRVKEAPDQPAIVFGDEQLTYAQLSAKANRLARRLLELGVGPEQLVGIVTEPSLDMIVAMLGIMKAGAGYMPIDSKYLADRVQFMLEDSQASVLLTQRHLAQRVEDFPRPVLVLEDEATYSQDDSELAALPKPDTMAYVIYTSGSTGKPKGVVIEHGCLFNFCSWFIDNYKMTAKDRATQFSSVGFDASIIDIYPTLAAGAQLHIISPEIKLSLHRLNEYLESNEITTTFLPTQFAEHFMALIDNRSLRLLTTGGEKLKRPNLRRYKLVNGYGPTECTVYSTTFNVGVEDLKRESLPIGRPLANTEAYIVDEALNLQPLGAPGELCFSGRLVGRGYLRRPDLTATRFIDNPFRPGEKMYRTGDLARWLPDGNLEFLGRIDFQVKIRGFRIEMGDVEQHMLQFVGLQEAVVLAREDDRGDKYLCAYYAGDHPIKPSEVREHLAQQLPKYMLPQHLIQLDQMPLNASGKVDRKALPVPKVDSTRVAPSDSLEERLVDIWKEIFELDEIGVTDDFFQLGGHSLNAVLLQSKIQDELEVELSFEDVFGAPTIQELASRIRKAEKVAHTHIPVIDQADHYPTTSAQKRLFFLEQMKNIGTTYNCPIRITLDGDLDESRLSTAIDAVIERHEGLRTSFAVVDGEAVQVVSKSVRLKKHFQETSEADLPAVFRTFVQPFDLTRPPLFRVKLLRLGSQHHELLFDAHHTVFDGTSVGVFVEDLMAYYQGTNPPPLRVQYRDFASWHRHLQTSEAIESQEKFWLDMYSDQVPVLELATDFPRGNFIDYRGEQYLRPLNPQLCDGLRKLSAASGCTLNMTIMAAFYLLLARYTSQSDIVLGTAIAGRNHLDAQPLVGMFVNTLPVRAFPADEKPFSQFLDEVREVFLASFSNQDYQFENLVEKLQLRRDSSRNPLFDAAMVYQSMGFPKMEIDGLKVAATELDHGHSVFDLLLEVLEDEEGLSINWNFRTSLFKRETIQRMATHLLNLLASVINDPDARLMDQKMLTDTEEDQLLTRWNQTAADYPKEKTAHQIFEEVVERFGERVAVNCDEHSLTYRELNNKANQLARQLREKGIGPDILVGILLDRSVEMIVGLMAVLKAGGGYLPILHEYPRERILYMLENSGAPVLLTAPKFMEIVDDYKGEKIDLTRADLFAGDDKNLEHVSGPDNLIYVIYTSGSTGKPKGVMLEHHNAVRLFINDDFQYDISENDVWSMFHSFSFDFSVWEIYGALLYGGRIAMVPSRVALDPALFVDFCKREKVTVLSQTPGAFYNFMAADLKTDDHELGIRYVTFGGEALQPKLLADWHQRYPETKLINMYGITETTVHVTFKEVTELEIENNVSNVGIPIPTLTTYVMDRHLQLVPVGVPGEIVVGGDGVARGYIKLPEKTADRFVTNPYRPEERLYRSGDLAKRLPNGDLAYLGRIDFQVKIRGFRVELGEIEDRLLRHKDLEKVAVLALDEKSGGSKFLTAYFTSSNPPTVHDLRDHLKEDLPEYMVPSYFVHLGEFPLTANGKLDRKVLPRPEATSRETVPARNQAEQKMVEVWQEVLGVQTVGVTDDFFELGGHSMKAVMLTSELRKWFDVTVNDIFDHPTIAALAAEVPMIGVGLRHRLLDIKRLVAELAHSRADFEASEEAKTRRQHYRQSNETYQAVDYSARRSYETVLLTGATGYLGVYLLQELMMQRASQVVVIVRGTDDEQAALRLKEKCEYYFGETFWSQFHPQRVRVVAGDLSKERLGLDAQVYSELEKSVDAIVHSAALVKHYGHHQEFYDANVGATINLLHLAASVRKKDFHHISTLSIAEGTTEGVGQRLFTEYDMDLGQESTNHYIQTKLAAEKEVDRARQEGVQANIYRIGNITFHSESGHLQQNISENAFYQQVRAFVNLGYVPQTEDEVEFSFVDRLSRAIVQLYDCGSLTNENFHLCNTHQEKLSEILTSPELGLQLTTCPFPEFVDFMLEHYDVPGPREHIEAVMLHRGWLSDDSQTVSTVLSDKTTDILGHLDFEWPALKTETALKLVLSCLSERLDFLAAMPLFSSLGQAELERLALIAHPEIIAPGHALLWEGEPDDRFCIIETGSMELSRHSPSGWVGTVMVSHPGEWLGENSLSGEETAPLTAEALFDHVKALTFEGSELRALIAREPALALAFLGSMSDRLRRLETLVVGQG
jgi:amino acid adenylation domain-containing protein/thioester reductase-like protein